MLWSGCSISQWGTIWRGLCPSQKLGVINTHDGRLQMVQSGVFSYALRFHGEELNTEVGKGGVKTDVRGQSP